MYLKIVYYTINCCTLRLFRVKFDPYDCDGFWIYINIHQSIPSQPRDIRSNLLMSYASAIWVLALKKYSWHLQRESSDKIVLKRWELKDFCNRTSLCRIAGISLLKA